MERKKVFFWLFLGVLIFAGLVVTVVDYREWRRLETQNYGQGWKDLKLNALELNEEVVDYQLGVKFKIASELRNTKYEIRLRQGNSGEIGEKTDQLEKPGGRGFVKYQAGKEIGGKIVVLETEVGEEDWGKWENTIKAIFESIQVI